MSTKQLSLPEIAEPAAVAILEFGRLLQEEDQRHNANRNPSHLLEAEEKLIAQFTSEKNTLLKSVLNFNVSKPREVLPQLVGGVVGQGIAGFAAPLMKVSPTMHASAVWLPSRNTK